MSVPEEVPAAGSFDAAEPAPVRAAPVPPAPLGRPEFVRSEASTRPEAADADPADARSWRHDAVVFAVLVVVLELAALPVGLLWGWLAPHPLYQVSGHQLGLVVGDAKPLVRGDGLFLVVTGVAGIIAGALTFWRARRAELGAALGLAAGGLMAAWLAWRIGHVWTGGTQFSTLVQQADNTKATLAPDLGARTVLVSWAVAAVATHALLYAVTWPAKPKPEPIPGHPAAEA